jgi:hypothetical protein
VQHSSFQLRTSSNTSSVPMNDAHESFANSDEKCTFHLATSVLRSAWMKRYNLRQGYNLDKLINQSEPTYGLASHTRN